MPMIDATTFAGIGIFIQQILTQTEDLFTPLGIISNAASNECAGCATDNGGREGDVSIATSAAGSGGTKGPNVKTGFADLGDEGEEEPQGGVYALVDRSTYAPHLLIYGFLYSGGNWGWFFHQNRCLEGDLGGKTCPNLIEQT